MTETEGDGVVRPMLPLRQGEKDRAITRMACLKAAAVLGRVGDEVLQLAERYEEWVYRDLAQSGDGYRGGSEENVTPFDPGTDSLPNAPRGKRMGDGLAKMQQLADPSMDWKAFRVPIYVDRYGKDSLARLDEAEQRDFFRRYGNALTRLTEKMQGGDFPTATDDEIQEAFGWAFPGYTALIPVDAPPPETAQASPSATESDGEPQTGTQVPSEAEKPAESTPAHAALDEEAAAKAAADA